MSEACLSIREIAERGEQIYRQQYQTEFEQRYNGKFVVVNIGTGDASVSDTSHDAVHAAMKKESTGPFHLMRVGSEAAF